jgi:hypothetical protein
MNEIIVVDLQRGTLKINGAIFNIANKIRTLKEGTRQSYEVVRSIPDNLPYDPHLFPKGTWNITGLDWQNEKKFDRKTYGSIKIKTDAWQLVNVWELDEEGDYLRETEKQVRDTCYWLHYSEYSTTLGCIKFVNDDDGVLVGNIIQRLFDKGESVQLEVI